MDRWMNIGIRGEAAWPEEETRVTFGGHEFLLKPVTKDTEASVHINLKSVDEITALTLINRFLSILCWCDDVPMENLYGGSGTSIPVAVPRNTSRSCGSCVGTYPFYRDLEKDPKARLALALYREALTVNSIPFSFLSYFKILNIFWKDKYDRKKGINELVEGIRMMLSRIHDTEANERINQIAGTQPDIPKYLYESGRCAIAHAYSVPLVDPDDVADLRRLSRDIWVIKAIAQKLIEERLNVSRDIIG
jgi:hypothetical protein